MDGQVDLLIADWNDVVHEPIAKEEAMQNPGTKAAVDKE